MTEGNQSGIKNKKPHRLPDAASQEVKGNGLVLNLALDGISSLGDFTAGCANVTACAADGIAGS